jgi:biopolymer transport protein ExbD
MTDQDDRMWPESGTRRRRAGDTNLVPLINLVFLLLMFFMLAGTFVEFRALQLELAGRGRPAAAAPELVLLRVRQDSRLEIEGIAVSMDELESQIAAAVADDPDRTVVVWADAEVPVELLVAVMDQIRAGGARNMRLAGGAPR